jgi:hypothetical protein
MNNKEIIKETLKNGGLTLDLKAKKGFMCSIYGMEKTFTIDHLEELEKELDNYKRIAKTKKGLYVGLWVNDNIIYLDLSKLYKSKSQAIKKGIENKQKAIYDLEHQKDIEILKDCYIVYKYNQLKNDFIYVKEFYNLKDIIKEYNLKNNKSIYHYITSSIDNVKELLNNQYIILKDNLFYNEYMEILEGLKGE